MEGNDLSQRIQSNLENLIKGLESESLVTLKRASGELLTCSIYAYSGTLRRAYINVPAESLIPEDAERRVVSFIGKSSEMDEYIFTALSSVGGNISAEAVHNILSSSQEIKDYLGLLHVAGYVGGEKGTYSLCVASMIAPDEEIKGNAIRKLVDLMTGGDPDMTERLNPEDLMRNRERLAILRTNPEILEIVRNTFEKVRDDLSNGFVLRNRAFDALAYVDAALGKYEEYSVARGKYSIQVCK